MTTRRNGGRPNYGHYWGYYSDGVALDRHVPHRDGRGRAPDPPQRVAPCQQLVVGQCNPRKGAPVCCCRSSRNLPETLLADLMISRSTSPSGRWLHDVGFWRRAPGCWGARRGPSTVARNACVLRTSAHRRSRSSESSSPLSNGLILRESGRAERQTRNPLVASRDIRKRFRRMPMNYE